MLGKVVGSVGLCGKWDKLRGVFLYAALLLSKLEHLVHRLLDWLLRAEKLLQFGHEVGEVSEGEASRASVRYCPIYCAIGHKGDRIVAARLFVGKLGESDEGD